MELDDCIVVLLDGKLSVVAWEDLKWKGEGCGKTRPDERVLRLDFKVHLWNNALDTDKSCQHINLQ